MSLKWLPNAFTLLRIIAAPAIALFVVRALGSSDAAEQAHYANLAFITFSLAALTDWVDGVLARALDATSELGAKLDLWADKIIVLAVLLAALAYLPIFAILGLICLSLRDVLVMRLRASRPDVNLKATFLAKSKTAIVMAGMALAMLGFFLSMNAASFNDTNGASDLMILTRIGLSLYVFGCVLSLGTGYESVSYTHLTLPTTPYV